MSKANLDVVQGVYVSFGAGDVPAILATLTEDVRWEVVGPAGTYPLFGERSGVAGALEFFQLVGEHEDFTEFTPLQFLTDGDKVVVLGRAAYTLKKTGRSVATDWVHVFTLRGGKVSGFQEIADSAQILAGYAA